MTNQANEDELKDRLTKLISQDGWVDNHEVDVEGQVAAIQTIIRTEKLKLLAEVRERVVGEFDKLDMGGSHNIAYNRNELREEQMTELNELEAEL